jgi:fatty-acyl-CoA synthase
VGRPLPGAEVRIVDPVTRRDVPRGSQGELATHGQFVMKGYYKMPGATAEAIDPEGWLYTGDLAVMDDRGYFRITGRAKDTINRGGENISPREIEEFLQTHPKVLDVQVLGVPSRLFGEEAAARIRLRPGGEAAPDEFLDHCRGRIARFKVPRYVVFVEDFPKTASGKVQKHRLREELIERLGLGDIPRIEIA